MPTSVPVEPSPQALRKADQALARVSRLLVSRAGADLDAILALIGQSFGADHVYVSFATASFVQGPYSAPAGGEVAAVPARWLGTSRTWSREGAPPIDTDVQDAVDAHARGVPADDTGRSGDPSRMPAVELFDGQPTAEAFALPLLSDDQRFVGYLGFVMPEDGRTLTAGHSRVLSVLGDILGAHLSRLAADEARATTEHRWQSLVDRHPDSILVTVGGRVIYANTAAAHLLGAPDADALRAFSLRDFLSAADEEAVERVQQAQLASATPTPAEYLIVRLDGERRHVESVSVPYSGPEGGVQIVLRDVTERVRSERRYHTFVETISEGVWRVDLDTPVDVALPPDEQAESILVSGRLAEINPAMQRLFRTTPPALGAPARSFAGTPGRLMFIALAQAGHRLHDYEMVVRERGVPPRYLSVNAVGQFDRGKLVSVWGSSTDVTERVAMERAMVDALEEQQERIGRDLHDSVGQLLTGVRMMSENVAAQVAGHPAAPTAERVAAYASEALDLVRAICRGLVPPHLYSEGVASALADLADQANSIGPARCSFRRTDDADLTEPDVALQFYRIAQEAISNALRHAHASHIQVLLGRTSTGVAMTIQDDGSGFALDGARVRSIGLFSMRRRAHLAGATLSIESTLGQGTAVRLLARPRQYVPPRLEVVPAPQGAGGA